MTTMRSSSLARLSCGSVGILVLRAPETGQINGWSVEFGTK